MKPPGDGRLDARAWSAVLSLAATQIVGWGTTFYLPAVLVRPWSTDLGLSREVVFGGTTVMLLVGAAAGPVIGSVTDRHGARGVMALGSLVMAAALAVLSQAGGLTLYVLAWLLIGIAGPMALSQAAVAALSQIARHRARRAIGAMLVLTSLSSTVFWPLSAWLEVHVGWRTTCLLYAGLHVLLCLPLHAFVQPKPENVDVPSSDSKPVQEANPTPLERSKRTAFVLAAIALSLAGFVTWGLPLHVIEILRSFGHPAAFSILVGALIGPAQVSARAAELAFGHRVSILSIGVLALFVMQVALLLLLLGGSAPSAAVGFALVFGLAAGAITVVRVVTPLQLFGQSGYATMMGRLGVPQNITFAFAPMVFAGFMREFGPGAAVVLACGAAMLGGMAMAALAWKDRSTD